MEIAIVGAGVLGSIFGALFLEKGFKVTLIEVLEERVRLIAKEGLWLQWPDGERTHSRIDITSNVDAVGDKDVVMIAVKGYHTRPAIEGARRVRAASVENLGRYLRGLAGGLRGRADAMQDLQAVMSSSDWMYATLAKAAIAIMLLVAGDPAKAERHAREAVDDSLPYPIVQTFALSALAGVLLGTGRHGEAAEHAKRGLETFEQGGGFAGVKKRLESILHKAQAADAD